MPKKGWIRICNVALDQLGDKRKQEFSFRLYAVADRRGLVTHQNSHQSGKEGGSKTKSLAKDVDTFEQRH